MHASLFGRIDDTERYDRMKDGAAWLIYFLGDEARSGPVPLLLDLISYSIARKCGTAAASE